ncbi:uncharacterized protein [Ptychodera flava]|uniref:uncharacterized protein isoform X2 n=1 Tax=Ptychodera flava TaxID=63121 RepID=UPI00396A0BF9
MATSSNSNTYCRDYRTEKRLQKAYVKKHSTLSTTSHLPLHKLRLAWNGFVRLLDLDFREAFYCNICGTHPDTVVCDGTGIGLQKELLQHFNEDDEATHLPPIIGTKHVDRVFIPSPQARKLLLQFAGLNPHYKYQTNLPPVSLTSEQYRQLITLLQKHSHLSSLTDVIQRISNNGTDLLAPPNYRSFLQDLARNSPSSSLLQSTDEVRTRHILKEVVIKGLNLFHSQHRDKLQVITQHAPLISDFIEAVSSNGSLPLDVRYLLKDILKRCKVPAPMTEVSNQYLQPNQGDLFKTLDFFPNMPKIHGAGNYKFDCREETRACRGLDTCNKFYKGHPSLSPGIFTMYCKHKVCLGFQVMKHHESPALPFKIIRQRFQTAPKIIIYDNACKLHQYCLNREPDFFKHTMFLVDRLHWCNHTGCSSGYNMDTYKSNKEIMKLNSQICEQTNASISRIKAQLSYMLPDNFIFHAALFLCLANKNVKDSLP